MKRMKRMKRMRRLTLDETWTLCMKMWRWIAKQIRKDPLSDVEGLKEEWLDNNGWDRVSLSDECFFCEYNYQHHKMGRDSCSKCPARMVDKSFGHYGCVIVDKWNYTTNPLAFYAKLQKLHKIYKAKKK